MSYRDAQVRTAVDRLPWPLLLLFTFGVCTVAVAMMVVGYPVAWLAEQAPKLARRARRLPMWLLGWVIVLAAMALCVPFLPYDLLRALARRVRGGAR